MNILDAFPSKYLKARDLKGTEPTVTIARVELEVLGRTREQCLVAYFAGKTKGLKLNKTCALAIAAIAGSEETERWAGTTIRLYATTAEFGKQAYPVIRITAATAPRLVNSTPNTGAA